MNYTHVSVLLLDFLAGASKLLRICGQKYIDVIWWGRAGVRGRAEPLQAVAAAAAAPEIDDPP